MYCMVVKTARLYEPVESLKEGASVFKSEVRVLVCKDT